MTRLGISGRSTTLGSVIRMVVGLLALVAMVVPVAFAANTQYYIDPNNSSCSDTGGGTSGTPWCSLAPASSHVFGPGDQLLLANGSSFTGQTLTIQGQGAPGNPIVVSSYQGYSPSTARPHIDGGSSPSVTTVPSGAAAVDVLLENPSYVTVSNLEVSGAGGGVVADYNSSYPYGSVTGNYGLTFNNIYAHNISGITQGTTTGAQGSSYWDFTCGGNHDLWVSSGVAVTGAFTANVPSGQFGVSGVTFNDIEGEHNFDTISTDWCDGQFGSPFGGQNVAHANLIQNVLVNHMYAHDGDGDGYPGMCGEGFRLSGTTNALVINSRMINLGACQVSTGTAGVILVAVTNVTFANDIIAGVPNTQSGDQTGLDHEVYNDQVKLRDNLFANNAGPAMEFLAIRSGIGDYNTNNEVTGNSFYGNLVSMSHVGGPTTLSFSSNPSNNVYADTAFVNPVGDPDLTLGTGNVQAQPGAVPQYAAYQYSSTQGFDNWSYQYGGTGAWQNMTAATSPNADLDYPWNGPNSEYVSRFEQAPGSGGQLAARVWTAPVSGTIAIRSRVFRSTFASAANVTAQITDNDVAVNSAVNVNAGDQIGSEDNVDQLAVKAGDVIRFVLSGDPPSTPADLTSWAPSITYVNATPAATNATVSDGNFESPAASGTPWTFSNSGIVSTAGANPNPALGTQVAVITGTGSISQVISGFSPGTTYTLSFLADDVTGGQALNVMIDGQLLQQITPTLWTYNAYTTLPFTLDNRSHVISIVGTLPYPQIAAIDNIQLNATPTGLNVANNGFETSALSAGTYQYDPSGASWTFSVNSGIASNGSGFGNPSAPQGGQVAFIQKTGSISQSISGFSASTSYVIGFMASQRPSNQQSITVSIDGKPLATITPIGEGFSFYFTPAFTTTPGTHTIQLAGTQTADETAFVDAVQIFPIYTTTLYPTNGSFELTGVPPDGYLYAPAALGWLFEPMQAGRAGDGIVSNGGEFGNPNAPPSSAPDAASTHAAFIQQAGKIQSFDQNGQTNTAASIQYCWLTMDVAPRPSQTQTLYVSVDGEPVGQITPTNSSYTAWSSPGYILQPGAKGAIQIVGGKTGVVLSDDNTAFVDNISTTCGH